MIAPTKNMLPASFQYYSYANIRNSSAISPNTKSYVRAMRVAFSSRVVVYLTPENTDMNCWAEFKAHFQKGSGRVVLTPRFKLAGHNINLDRVRSCGRIYAWPVDQWSFQVDRNVSSLGTGNSKRLRAAIGASGKCRKYKWIVSSAKDGRRRFKLAVKPEDRFQFEHLWNAAASETKLGTHNVSAHQRSLGHWVDKTFPHNNASLYKNGRSPASGTNNNIEWRRAGDFSPSTRNEDCYTRMFKKIEPNDIAQGSLGDCWLMCALSALAEYPERVRKVFDYTKLKEGKYGVRLWVDGTPKVFYLDDYFPCKPKGGPAYGKTKDGELWVALIEKAFAKHFGCYESLDGGYLSTALSKLTGFKCENFSWKTASNANKVKRWVKKHSKDHIWEMLLDLDKKKYIMTGSGVGPSNPKGLFGGHAYTLLGVHDLTLGMRGERVKLVELRNPWGSGEWIGDWSDRSGTWNMIPKEHKQRLLKKANDGKFFMSLEDFHRYFGDFTVCYYRDATAPISEGLKTERPVPEGLNSRRPQLTKVAKLIGRFPKVSKLAPIPEGLNPRLVT